MWRKVALFLLITILILLISSYAALAESFVVWLFWNYGIAAVFPAPLVSYLQCAAFLIIPNFILITYRAFTVYKNL